MDGWFRFKGKSSKDFGILIASVPQRIRPSRRAEEIEIPGRNGILTQDEGAYDAYTISMECSTRGGDRLDEIATWLDGAGDLILSTEPDKVYQASIYNKISISDVIYLYNRFLLQFRVQPFKYSVNAFGDRLVLHQPTAIRAKGTIYSEPILTVYGSGDVTLTVNTKEYRLYSVEGSITIDSERMEVYKDAENQNSKYGATDFPRFDVGENHISWTGRVERVEIIPRWRWL